MTGVGETPRTLEELIVSRGKRVTSLERALVTKGAIDLSRYLDVGPGLTAEGLGTLDEPYTISLASTEVTDWDDATEPGDYWAEPETPNAPVPGPMFLGTVRIMGGGDYEGRLIQELVPPSSGVSGAPLSWGRYVRRFDGTSWGTWRQTNPLSGSVTFAGSGGATRATAAVTFPTGYFVNSPWVIMGGATSTAAALVGEGANATVAGFTAYLVLAPGTAFTGTYTLKWIAQEPFA